MDIVFLDFRKAFDTVSHPILIKKLGVCGVNAHAVRWVANWLEGCTQGVVVDRSFFNLEGCGWVVGWGPPRLSPWACTVQHLYQ